MTKAPGAGGSIAARVRETFTFARARAELDALGPETLASLTRKLGLAEQRRAAAEALHFQGHRAESIRLVREAFEGAADAAGHYADARTDASDDASPLVRALVARGRSKADADAVESSLVAVRATVVPELDADDGAENDDVFVRALEGTEAILSSLELVGSTNAELRSRGRNRIAGLVAAVLVSIAAIVFFTRTPAGLRAEASAFLWNGFGPELAVDGRDDTRFLLPDGVPGYLDVFVSPTQRIHHVILLNSINAPYNDRATKDYAIEIYSGGRVVKRIPGSFEYSLAPTRVSVPVDVDRVDRIRIQLVNFHRTGAGLSEVGVD